MIGERIKSVRIRLGMTQEQFARKIKCSSNFISRLERGVANPSKKVLKMICSSFGISEEWLTEGNGEANLDSSLILSKNGVAERIRKLRKDYGLTQKKFGDTVGVSASAIQSIELGKRNASDNLLNAIAEKYLCSYEWLVSGRDKLLTEEEIERAKRVVADFRAFFNSQESDDVLVSAMEKEPDILTSLDRLVQQLSNNPALS